MSQECRAAFLSVGFAIELCTRIGGRAMPVIEAGSPWKRTGGLPRSSGGAPASASWDVTLFCPAQASTSGAVALDNQGRSLS